MATDTRVLGWVDGAWGRASRMHSLCFVGTECAEQHSRVVLGSRVFDCMTVSVYLCRNHLATARGVSCLLIRHWNVPLHIPGGCDQADHTL